MTRLSMRAAMGVGGVVVGGLIWASAVLSQDDRNPLGPGASFEVRPDEAKPPATGSPTGTTRVFGLQAPSPQPTVDPNPPVVSGAGSAAGPGEGGSPAAPLRPGETATERAKQQVQHVETPVPTEGGGLYFFGAGAPGLPSPQQAVQAEPLSLHVFKLKRANARSLKEIVETLVPTSRGRVAIDASTNTLILRASDSVFAEVEPVINELDSLEVRRADPFGGGAAKGRGGRGGSGFGGTAPGAMSGPGLGGFGATSGGAINDGPGGGMGGLGDPLVQQVPPPAISASDLRTSYERADKAARDLAATMKTHPYDDAQRADLRNKVAYAFSLRQTLVQLELAEMQRRIESIQESIDLRYKLTAQIVDRRVAELLDPNLQWEPASTPRIGASGFIDANGVQWPRPAGLPGGMGTGGMGREPQPGSGVRGAMLPEVDPARASFTTAPPGVPTTDLTPMLPTNGSGAGGGEAGEGIGPGSGVLPSSSNLSDNANAAKSGPLWILHMSAPSRGAERDATAIVIDANEQRSILLSASWSAQRFPIGEEGAPIESMTLVGSKLPVRMIAADEQLGLAIYSVPGKLVTWPVNWLASDVRVGDVLYEAIGGHHVAMPGAARRVESLGNTFVSGTSIPKDAKVEGTFVLDGRMSGNPGSILLKNGLLAGMFLDNSQSRDASGQKPHVLPTKALLERAHQLIERGDENVGGKLIRN